VEGTPDLSETAQVVDHQEENFVFTDEAQGEHVDVSQPLESSFDEHEDYAASLGKYLERPVLIDTFTWAESDTWSNSPRKINPWNLYFRNTYIKNKLQNFSRLHCTLKLTFRFNASPFYYGSMRVCYDPLQSGKFDPIDSADMVPLSQTPGVYLEPQESTSASLSLPFLYPQDWLDTSHDEYVAGMGDIIFALFAPLRSANGVSGEGITISTYCQAQDVKVAGPTVVTVMQSGIVSGPAAALAVAAGAYTSHAKIGPYAKAVKVGATLVSTVARMFGYSNAPVMDNVQPVQNKVYHAFANTETCCPIDKLAIDPKNEVTLDNRVAGIDPIDELDISALVTRPSFVGSVDWSDTTAVGARLCMGKVTPCIDVLSTGTGQTIHHFTPSGWIASAFRYWRGGVKLHFKIIRSKYQKGRLMVNWDPNGSLNASGLETALYTKIFDLASPEQGFDFVIPYKAATPWLVSRGRLAFSTSSPGYSMESTNGNWQLSVVNALTGPVADATVTVLFYVSACEDMEFAAPKALPYCTTQEVQSGSVSGPVDGSTIACSTRIHEYTMGERVLSLRALLHRTTFVMQQVIGADAGQNHHNAGRIHSANYYPRIPLEPGFDANYGVNRAKSILAPTTNKNANFSKMHPINWVLCAFAGYRGSINAHANITCNGNVSQISNASISRIDHSWIQKTTARQRNVSSVHCTNDNTLAEVAELGYMPLEIPTGCGGMTVTNGQTQMALSANMPQYCPGRFYPAWVDHRDTFQVLGRVFDGFRVDVDYNVAEDAVEDMTIHPLVSMYYSAGVDFNAVFFTGVPHLYEYEMEPSPE
jgi:hypothetical protein